MALARHSGEPGNRAARVPSVVKGPSLVGPISNSVCPLRLSSPLKGTVTAIQPADRASAVAVPVTVWVAAAPGRARPRLARLTRITRMNGANRRDIASPPLDGGAVGPGAA